MKQIFYLLCSAAMLSSCANKNTPANEFNNREIAALMQVDQTFNKLSKIVDSMSAGLSETEQQRAAYFSGKRV